MASVRPDPAIASSSISCHHTSPTLLGLPIEIRIRIYDNLARMPDLLRPDWRYSPCLIYVCRQIYAETIELLYRDTKFTFSSPERCIQLLSSVGHNAMYIRCLDIWYYKLQALQLRAALKKLGNESHLHTLELLPLRRGGRVRFPDSVARFTSFERFPGQTQHPLGILKNLRCWKVGDDIEAEGFEQSINAVLNQMRTMAEAEEGTQVVISRWFDKRPGYYVGDMALSGNEELGGYWYRVHDGKPVV
ncbi:hypothetical protein BP6252_04694 [Coleophoma cylindrospora]|uniref:DUF7730 domain-containing protein n=1 Tax=Coleophoma cylindrospora TaxID=1849047 RepID=A0A3D8S1C2_9HELO|nr:hypothetical protein BP6252_04694 [Coleophoma cylindrospora]